jgi:hypothetical protein
MSSDEEEVQTKVTVEQESHCLRLIEATSSFGISLENYCNDKNLLIAESLRYDDIYNFLTELLDN